MKTPIHLDQPTTRWRLTVAGHARDPLLLARVLQKAAVPEIELLAARYTREPAEIELLLSCTAARATLTREKLARLYAVQRTTLVADECIETDSHRFTAPAD